MFAYDAQTGPVWKLFFLLTSYGHQAVVVFFVLSGFLVGGSVVDEMRNGRFTWRVYLAKRIARLYPVFLLGLFVGLGMDNLGVHYFNHYQISYHHGGIYSTWSWEIGSIKPIVATNLGPQVFFANLLMLQTIVQPPLGSNGPLWSLCNEFWYYALFPLAATLVLRKGSGVAAKLVCVLIFAAIAWMVGPEIMSYFLIWLLGVAAAIFASNSNLSRVLAFISPICVLLALAYCKYRDRSNDGGFGPDILLGVTIAMLIYAFKTSQTLRVGPPRVHRFLADFSYSLYIIHFPFLTLIMAILSDHTRFHFLGRATGSGLAIFIALILLAELTAFCVSLITERRTNVVRDALLRLITSDSRSEDTKVGKNEGALKVDGV
jgi:peptidoglycan/LPS O-acetylase OafA/YrhL